MIRKDAGLYCGPRLRKGEVFAYVGLPQNLKDLKDPDRESRRGADSASQREVALPPPPLLRHQQASLR